MAATYPSGDEEREDRTHERLSLASTTAPAHRPRWITVAVVVVALAVIAVVAYMLLYGGGSSGGGGGGGGGTSGYSMIPFSAEALRRIAQKVRR